MQRSRHLTYDSFNLTIADLSDYCEGDGISGHGIGYLEDNEN